MNTDAELLGRYAESRSEAAFAEFVRRHLNLVYFAALRRTGGAPLAEDIVQRVFTEAARDAALSGGPWLAAKIPCAVFGSAAISMCR